MDKTTLSRILVDDQELFFAHNAVIKRDVEIGPLLRSSDISVVTGVRRCGKSTLLRQIVDSAPEYRWLYLDLESPRLSAFTVDDFELCDQIWREQSDAKQGRPIALVIDEVQNVEGWERWVRFFAEKRRYKVFVTGSNSEMLSSELGTALGGRYVNLELFPFSFKEIVDHHFGSQSCSELKSSQPTAEVRAVVNSIINQGFEYGLFPKPFLERSRIIYPHLFQDIVSRDIVTRRKIRKPIPLIELGALLARDNTRLFNATTTTKLIELDDARTLSKYLSYFQDAYLFFRVRRYSRSRRKQLRGLSKFYCIDSVLADEVSAQRQRWTNALESIVHIELQRRREHFGFWLSSNGYEVDFILENKQGGLTAIQACFDLNSSETISREVRALLAAQREEKAEKLIVVTRDEVSASVRSTIPESIIVQSLAEFLGLYAL
jgi:predicted AAA+ superfamily ATPase